MYEGISGAVATFERSLQRIMESEDGKNPAGGLLCHVFVECARALSGSLSQTSIDELKHMKTSVKDRLAQYEFDFKQRSKELNTARQALEKCEQAFAKTQAEIRRVHAKSLEAAGEGSRRRSFSWSPMRVESKDELFEKLQKLVHEQTRLCSESECLLNQVSSGHQAGYTRLSVVVNELGSMRRRLNRRTGSEVKNVVNCVSKNLTRMISETFAQVGAKADQCCPSTGDFGMKLPSINESLASIVGPDASDRIHKMMQVPESRVLEYRAVQSYLAKEKGELSFNRNEKIEVIKKDSSGWWTGRNPKGQVGVFPSVFLAQRPAGAMLPLQQNAATSFKPGISSLGTVMDENSEKNRAKLVENNPPFSFIGIVHFNFNGNGISVEAGEVVDVQQLDKATDLPSHHDHHLAVIVVNHRGIRGVVPLHILTLKYRDDQENDPFNLSSSATPF